ncbi:MAG: hypothetical protein COB02_10060 [Candidatus Cloacimonadota bacterium]|nr:MAG: hypothetical protein COB02_10060 [Candidatus Cloacimonadota bacterium]
MFFIEDVMVSEGLKTLKFGCNLEKCKGLCCVDGDLGGPVTKDEQDWIKNNKDSFYEHLSEDAKAVVDRDGLIYKDNDGAYTPLLEEAGACVYLTEDIDGIQKCIFERLYFERKIDFRKPLSCHLFPLLVSENHYSKVLSFEKRATCNGCFTKDSKLMVKFEQEALTRQFGQDWVKKLYEALNIEV